MKAAAVEELHKQPEGEKHFPSSSGEMFGNYFTPNRSWSFKKTDLLDTRARRTFENTALACSVNAYPFHMPLEAKSGLTGCCGWSRDADDVFLRLSGLYWRSPD